MRKNGSGPILLMKVVTSGEDFNTFYDVYLKSQESLVEIDYHTTTHQGKVVSKKHFGNESTYCWDSALLNIDC